jgi:hypothetical protein
LHGLCRDAPRTLDVTVVAMSTRFLRSGTPLHSAESGSAPDNPSIGDRSMRPGLPSGG